MSRHLIITLIYLCLTLLAWGEDLYTFTDSQGRTLEAKPLRMHGDRVEIERADGQTFIVDPAIFIAKDQQYLAKWQRKKAMDTGAIEVKATSSTSRKEKEDNGAQVFKHYSGLYKVQIRNNSDFTFKDLEVEYRFFVFHNELAADRRSEGKIERIVGNKKLASLAAYRDFEFETKSAEMTDTELKSGWVYTNGGKDKSEDELQGIWVRVYKGKEMIAEFANPSNLPEKKDW